MAAQPDRPAPRGRHRRARKPSPRRDASSRPRRTEYRIRVDRRRRPARLARGAGERVRENQSRPTSAMGPGVDRFRSVRVRDERADLPHARQAERTGCVAAASRSCGDHLRRLLRRLRIRRALLLACLESTLGRSDRASRPMSPLVGPGLRSRRMRGMSRRIRPRFDLDEGSLRSVLEQRSERNRRRHHGRLDAGKHDPFLPEPRDTSHRSGDRAVRQHRPRIVLAHRKPHRLSVVDKCTIPAQLRPGADLVDRVPDGLFRDPPRDAGPGGGARLTTASRA